ncbi:MAG: phosphoribosylformylglycinamidine synthase subunit PurL, partial [Planctomycetota bacterium]|nr:phosphoribosylformylglycinamidine synthase subunit PurL [Planctomycetota bacterium]
MSLTYTVTILHDLDPNPSPDHDLREALMAVGCSPDEGDLLASDPIFYLRIPEQDADRVEALAQQFLAGSPACRAVVHPGVTMPPRDEGQAAIVVQRRPGVMDPVSQSVIHAMSESGFVSSQCQVRTARRYRIGGIETNVPMLDGLASRLGNGIVDEWRSFSGGEEEQVPDPFREFPSHSQGRVEIALIDASDEELVAISVDGGLSLDLAEMQAIRQHYIERGREPSEIELETIAQTWSEHCCHKTLTGAIRHGDLRYGNLLQETIFQATRQLDLPWCWSIFRDNAGVIGIDEEWGVSFKVETHNHPSALEPYGGAGTGIGGVIRDTLGTGVGARPILNTDVFCFAPTDTAAEDLPTGTLHPRRLLRGVVAGVRDYGNRMGIPTANGAIHFHPGFVGNPLVFCGSVGLIRREHVDKEVHPGDLVVAVGGKTGRDGIHGATFSSRELTEDSEQDSSGAVQIGNPLEEKKVLDAMMRIRDENLCRSVTDCGAGGFSSAVGEMGEETGAEIHLDRAPLKYPGLGPTEVWISEAQERMVFAVEPSKLGRIQEILLEEEVECAVLGEFRDDGKLRLLHHDQLVGELDVKFLHGGRPSQERVSIPPEPKPLIKAEVDHLDAQQLLCTLLADGNVASKEPVIRQYDHEVQGRMTLRPLAGADRDAPMDGCALDPLRDGSHQVVVSCGLTLGMGEVDPYQMACHSVDEALRNCIASGGSLERAALLDNYAWGDVKDPAILGQIVECSRGAADAALAYGTPFISGKDSLHNTYRAGGVSRSIPPVLLVSAISITKGPLRVPGSDLKEAGSSMMLIGPEGAIPGSLMQWLHGGGGGIPAPFDGELGPRLLQQVRQWIVAGQLRSLHDLSDGGLAVAAAEMAFGGGGIGLDLDIGDLGADRNRSLFGEGPHRFLAEVRDTDVERITADAEAVGIPLTCIGRSVVEPTLIIRHGLDRCIESGVGELKQIWKRSLEAIWPTS